MGVLPSKRQHFLERVCAPLDLPVPKTTTVDIATIPLHRPTPPPRPSSPPDVPSSSAAPELRSAPLPAPCADAHPTSVPPRSPTQRQTRTPDESARIAPPWLSNPTRPPSLISTEKQGRVRTAQGWANLNRHTGPNQNARIKNFLLENWDHTDLGNDWAIYSTEDEPEAGNQFPTDVGRVDILAVHKREPKMLVIELKRDQSTDATVGQVLRYIGWVEKIGRAHA